MSIASDLATVLRQASPITGAITGKTVTVHVGAIRQRDSSGNIPKPPAIVLTNLSHDNFLTIDNPGNIATGTRKATLDIDCRGVTEEEADLIRYQVERFLDDYSGSPGGSHVDAIDLTDMGDDEEVPEHGEGLPTFVKTIEAEVIYRRQ